MTSLLSPEIVTAAELTERCDSCNAAAKMELALSSGGSLAFCGHHANKHAERLVSMATKVTLEEGFEWAGRSPSA
ncbi:MULTISPECIES: DUF7455 domain-containing protein [Winogradskya]|jgi:hypothetical protein|nr:MULTISPECIES: hypothetical protein [Actinoplanes]GIE21012.1 hypothetical protein Ahu01nite_041140 [Actinoplanes humidus]